MEIELTYTKVGDYYIPNLALEPQPGQVWAAASAVSERASTGLVQSPDLERQAVRPSA